METELTLPLAFLAGLAGAGHCWAMCGGLVSGLFVLAGSGRPVYMHLAYHGGRVLAYTLLGAFAAGIGQAIVLTGGVGRAQGVLYIIAGCAVVLAGLRVAGWLSWPAWPGKPRLAWPLAGFLNGLMPCALVFSMALKAATAASVLQGASWLFAFGLGTVPAMALAAVLAHGLGTRSLRWLRQLAALLVIALGVQAIWAGAKFFHVMLHL